jgi:hypothetical protein
VDDPPREPYLAPDRRQRHAVGERQDRLCAHHVSVRHGDRACDLLKQLALVAGQLDLDRGLVGSPSQFSDEICRHSITPIAGGNFLADHVLAGRCT